MALSRDDLHRRRFLLRNPFDRHVRMGLHAVVPPFLSERGWRLEFVSAGGSAFGLQPGASKEIVCSMVRGHPIDRASLPRSELERAIVITAQADGIPLGGMSYVIDPDYIDPNKGHIPSPPAKADPCSQDASELLKCLNLERAEVDGVEVRSITIDVNFKRRGC